MYRINKIKILSIMKILLILSENYNHFVQDFYIATFLGFQPQADTKSALKRTNASF